MANGQTIILATRAARQRAHALVDAAPQNAVLNIQEQRRSNEQNDKMWAMLSDVARAKPEGRVMPTHKWKALAMDMAGCKPDWERSLDGQSVVCVGYKSSRLSVSEMRDVIEALYAYGAEHGVEWTEPKAEAERGAG